MERLNKVLAQAGIGSRRNADELIKAGRIRVNGDPALVGQKISVDDSVTFDNQLINRNTKTIVIKFNKPRGVAVTKKDAYSPVTVMDFLPPHYQHLNPVGRLDKLSSGLLLFTNDGNMANRLTHPSYEHEKEYRVDFTCRTRLSKQAVTDKLFDLQSRIVNAEAQTLPIQISHSLFDPKSQRGSTTVILKEGKKRQIRRLFLSVGLFVTDLTRTRIGQIKLDNLGIGHYANVDLNELNPI